MVLSEHFPAFLPFEVVELKRQNVDVNPEYSDSLDAELFTVHLMFEKPSAATHEAVELEGGKARLALNAALPPRLTGKDAFEMGLDEVLSYMHYSLYKFIVLTVIHCNIMCLYFTFPIFFHLNNIFPLNYP